MRKVLLTFILVMAFVVFLSGGKALSQKKPYTFKVNIKITTPAKEWENKVRSYLSRELRSLGDVVIDDELTEWQLEIIVSPLRQRDGYLTGLALSTVVISKMDMPYDFGPSPSRLFWRHEVSVCSPETLKDTCQKIVAEFDGSELEFIRTTIRELEKHKQKNN